MYSLSKKCCSINFRSKTKTFESCDVGLRGLTIPYFKISSGKTFSYASFQIVLFLYKPIGGVETFYSAFCPIKIWPTRRNTFKMLTIFLFIINPQVRGHQLTIFLSTFITILLLLIKLEFHLLNNN